ncbi:MAG: MlaD family protein [Candidatus Omnitrophota bacterium]
MRKFSNEFKVGLLILLAAAAGVYLFSRTEHFTKETYTLKTYFNYAGGLKDNCTVTLSGVEVGRVTEIGFIYNPDTKVEIEMSINKGVKVRRNAIAYITSTGFVGDSFIGITSGTGDAPFAEDGDALESEDPVQMRELMKRAETISEKLDETLVDVRGLAQNLNSTVADNRQNIDSIISNIEQTSVNFNEFSDDIKRNPWKLLIKGKSDK